MSSAAVMIGALRVNLGINMTLRLNLSITGATAYLGDKFPKCISENKKV